MNSFHDLFSTPAVETPVTALSVLYQELGMSQVSMGFGLVPPARTKLRKLCMCFHLGSSYSQDEEASLPVVIPDVPVSFSHLCLGLT